MGGQFWVGGWWGSPSYVSFMTDVGGLEIKEPMGARAKAYRDSCEQCCWWWPRQGIVVMCERPGTINRDAQGRLHSTTGPAIGWRGWGVYAVHGIRLPAWLIEEPARLTVDAIHQETNAEIRRVMIELYGLDRYVRDAQFEVLDTDVDPVGQPRRLLRRDDVMVVELTNSTEDADGTRRKYHVACEPSLRPMMAGGRLGEPQKATALNAVASTYGMRGEDYVLAMET